MKLRNVHVHKIKIIIWTCVVSAFIIYNTGLLTPTKVNKVREILNSENAIRQDFLLDLQNPRTFSINEISADTENLNEKAFFIAPSDGLAFPEINNIIENENHSHKSVLSGVEYVPNIQDILKGDFTPVNEVSAPGRLRNADFRNNLEQFTDL